MTIEMGKDVVLVTSGGRTGTSFFAERLDEIISDCFSVHEPDVWHGPFRPDSWRAVRWFGFYHVAIGKLLRRTGMRCVGERYLSGDWSEAETVEAITRQRKDFYRSRTASLIVESNTQWYGLLPLVPQILPSYRVLALVRDPRTWVRSWVNYGAHHDDRDRVAKFGLPRLSPEMVGGEWEGRWAEMDVFQRLCWDWRWITSRLLDAADTDPLVRLVRFEDLFYSDRRRERLDEVLAFLTDFGERRYEYRIPPGFFERKVNVSRPTRLGPWEEWSESRRRFLLVMCGPLMDRLGYSLEDDPRRSTAAGA